jgi:A/G-specific adenine glycosylase
METVTFFQSFIWDFYHKNGRAFAWRNIESEYCVLVSEIMLQQTQTHRVITKYEEFLIAFPSIQLLADASLRDVLSVWQGLGYYRRARYLHQIAKIIVEKYNGQLPQDTKALEALPGIGPATAASICAFAFNMPTVFIETNIRAVFIHHFFSHKEDVTDKEIMPLIAASVDQINPREWYYSLMDYGVWLKSQHKNPSRKSAHYTKQSKFDGSDRQIRATILKLVTEKDMINSVDIFIKINDDQERVERIIQQLENENFIIKNINGMYTIV